MARRTKVVPITDEGRDKGKRFLITEMVRFSGGSVGFRVLLALTNNNASNAGGLKTGMAGLAQIGLRGLTGLPWFVAEPLLKEMFECVQVCPDAKNLNIVRPLEPAGGEGDYDIEEVLTRIKLRKEIFQLHVDFSSAAIQSLFGKVKEAAGKQSRTGTESRK
jgi:hypothetical protein